MQITIGSHVKSRFNTYLEVRYIARYGKERGHEQLFRFEVEQLKAVEEFQEVQGELFIKDCCQVNHHLIAIIIGIKNPSSLFKIAIIDVIECSFKKAIHFPIKYRGFGKEFEIMKHARLSMASVKQSKLIIMAHAYTNK